MNYAQYLQELAWRLERGGRPDEADVAALRTIAVYLDRAERGSAVLDEMIGRLEEEEGSYATHGTRLTP